MSEEPTGLLSFKEPYDKLRFPIFMTIRKISWDSFRQGQYVEIKIEEPEEMYWGKAQVFHKENIHLCSIPDNLLKYDIGRETQEGALRELQQFYPDLETTSKVVVYILGWIDKKPEAPGVDISHFLQGSKKIIEEEAE